MRGSEAVKSLATATQFDSTHSRVGTAARKAAPSLAPFSAPAFIPVIRAATGLHARSDLHLARKTWHMFMGCAIAFLFWAGMSIPTAVTILGSVLVWDLCMEGARLKIPSFNAKLIRI